MARSGEREGGQVKKNEPTKTMMAEKCYFMSLVSENLKMSETG